MGLHYILILIISLSLIFYKYNQMISDSNMEPFSNYNSNYKLLNPFVGYKLNMPIQKIIKIGGEFNMHTYSEMNKFLSYKFNLDAVNDNPINTLNKLNNNEISLAFVSEDIFLDAYNGVNSFSKPLKNLRFIVGLCYELFYFIFPGSSEVNSLDDLKDKKKKIKIGTTSKNSISDIVFKKLKSMYQLESVEYTNHSTNELFNKFYRNELDGIFYITGIFDPYILNILDLKSIKFLELETIKLIKSFFSKIISKKINVNNYEIKSLNSKEDIDNKQKYTGLTDTLGNRILLVTNKSTDTELVYDNVKFIFENHLIIRNTLSSLNKSSYSTQLKIYKSNAYYNDFIPLTMSYIDKNIIIHKGAEKYYREIGFITNNPSYECNELVGIESCDKKNIDVDKKQYYWKHKKIGLKSYEL